MPSDEDADILAEARSVLAAMAPEGATRLENDPSLDGMLPQVYEELRNLAARYSQW